MQPPTVAPEKRGGSKASICPLSANKASISLIGVPLGIQRQRSSSSIGLGISVIVIFAYYAIMSMTMALGQGGTLPAVIAVWIPNALGLAAGLYLVEVKYEPRWGLPVSSDVLLPDSLGL